MHDARDTDETGRRAFADDAPFSTSGDQPARRYSYGRVDLPARHGDGTLDDGAVLARGELSAELAG